MLLAKDLLRDVTTCGRHSGPVTHETHHPRVPGSSPTHMSTLGRVTEEGVRGLGFRDPVIHPAAVLLLTVDLSVVHTRASLENEVRFTKAHLLHPEIGCLKWSR